MRNNNTTGGFFDFLVFGITTKSMISVASFATGTIQQCGA